MKRRVVQGEVEKEVRIVQGEVEKEVNYRPWIGDMLPSPTALLSVEIQCEPQMQTIVIF